jgi:hypothetical protein
MGLFLFIKLIVKSLLPLFALAIFLFWFAAAKPPQTKIKK